MDIEKPTLRIHRLVFRMQAEEQRSVSRYGPPIQCISHGYLIRVGESAKEIVSATIRSSNARLRSKVTGEHHSVALRSIDALGSDRFHVLHEPGLLQRRFEAQFIRAVGQLKYEDRYNARPSNAHRREIVKSVEPQQDRLIVSLGGSTDLAELASKILPVADADGFLDSGIPGLRYSSSAQGITLFLPDHDAEIILSRVSAKGWARAVAEAESSPDSHLTFLSRYETVTALELQAISPGESSWEDSRSDAESAFLRRIMAVDVLNPSLISVWMALPEEFHVAIWVDEHDEEREENLIKLMTNERFLPHLALVERQGHWLDFELASGRRVVIRIQLAPTSPAAARLRDSFYP